MKVLTWSESLTAVSQRTETSWGKPNYMQTQPGVKEKTATHLTQDSENEKYSWVEGMESTAERRELEDTMMIAVNTIYRTSRDTTKTAEPPPTLCTASSKQSPHGYVLAQSHQSPTTVRKEAATGTNDSERELCSYMDRTTPYRGVKDTILEHNIYVNNDEPDLPIPPCIRTYNTRTLPCGAIWDNEHDNKKQKKDLMSRQSDPKLTEITATRASNEEDGELGLSPLINENQEKIHYIVLRSMIKSPGPFETSMKLKHYLTPQPHGRIEKNCEILEQELQQTKARHPRMT